MTEKEIGIIIGLFNRDGYVLNFSTPKFDAFTASSIGVALCDKFGLSKGKSLISFYKTSSLSEQIKLTSDLLDYYEIYFLDNKHELFHYKKLYEKSRIIVGNYNSGYISINTLESQNPSNYVQGLVITLNKNIEQGDYDSVITKSRTLIEEILILGLENKDISIPRTGNISELYRSFCKEYNMHITQSMDDRIKRLLNSLKDTINSVSEMRNISSDSHGIGNTRIRLEKHHAEFYMNISLSLASFLLSIINNSKN